MIQISENLYLYESTCNVYVVRCGERAVLIDFGDGSVLDACASLGLQACAVLLTHHHRDQCQGLRRANEAGIPVWVPHTEQDLFHNVELMWQGRALDNTYNPRQDRFSLLEPVEVAGTLKDYARVDFSGVTIEVIPTPGHTVGSISLMAEIDGQRQVFCGDLIAGEGKVWSLAALQWTYQHMEGAPASILSLLELKKRFLNRLLPSHGEVINEPEAAIDLLVERLSCLLADRGENPNLFRWIDQPYEPVTPHVLLNRTSTANSYVLLSESGKALLIDYGYDFMTGAAAGEDRASRRPWLYSLPALKKTYSVTKISTVIPTHFHDDHVAGLNLLRSVEGTEIWAPDNFAGILENSRAYDLPCLWYDPIPVDRRLPFCEPLRWEEYTFQIYPLPGHTRYAAAIFFEVDGLRLLASGDQYKDRDADAWNYVYHNHLQDTDYLQSAELFSRLQPDLILTGHWGAVQAGPAYLDRLRARGERFVALHRELLIDGVIGLDAEGFVARLTPYQTEAEAGERLKYQVQVINPQDSAAEITIRPVVPEGWLALPAVIRLGAEPGETVHAGFTVQPPEGLRLRRARVAVDIDIGGRRYGEQAEALVTLR